MKTLNLNIPPILKWIVFLLFISLILSALWGCSPAKKLEKSERRVLADIESVKRVRAKTDALFPIISKVVYRDTGSIKITRKDSIINVKEYFPVKVWNRASFDTLINGLSFYIDSNGITVTGKYLCPSYDKEIHTNDYFIDERQYKNLQDELAASRLSEAKKDGQIIQLERDNKKLEKQYRWLLIGVVSFVVLLIIYALYKSDKRMQLLNKLK